MDICNVTCGQAGKDACDKCKETCKRAFPNSGSGSITPHFFAVAATLVPLAILKIVN